MADPARKPSQREARQGDPFGDGYQEVPGREARTALSALNLRTALAVFGLVACGFLAWWSIELGAPVAAGILSFLAITAVIDLIVIQRRKRQRVAGQPGRTHYSIFE